MSAKFLPDHEYLGKLRVADLVAKTAKVTRKDTIRVLLAALTVQRAFGQGLGDMVPDDMDFGLARATPEQRAAVEQAYALVERDDALRSTPERGILRRIIYYT